MGHGPYHKSKAALRRSRTRSNDTADRTCRFVAGLPSTYSQWVYEGEGLHFFSDVYLDKEHMNVHEKVGQRTDAEVNLVVVQLSI